jgi:hypothetical protein
VRIALFAAALLIGARFILRIRYTLRDTQARIHLNPIV